MSVVRTPLVMVVPAFSVMLLPTTAIRCLPAYSAPEVIVR